MSNVLSGFRRGAVPRARPAHVRGVDARAQIDDIPEPEDPRSVRGDGRGARLAVTIACRVSLA
jgi:hypothetical protein